MRSPHRGAQVQATLADLARLAGSSIVSVAGHPTGEFKVGHDDLVPAHSRDGRGFFNFSILPARQPAGLRYEKALMLPVMVPRTVFRKVPFSGSRLWRDAATRQSYPSRIAPS
jgi:hypothetical protein